MAQKEDNSAFYAILIFIALLIAMILAAAMYSSESKADQATFQVDDSKNITLTEVCLNGRLFLTTTSGTGRFYNRGVSTIQVMHEIRRRSILLPVLCTAIQGSSTEFIMSGQE